MKFARVKNGFRRLMHSPLLFKAGNIEVYYYIDHDVGGSTFGQAV
jgi:hypothetical protein